MKPKHKKEIIAKEVRAIYNQLQVIGKKQRALGYFKLEKPIRYGWFKQVVLTENVSRYKNQKAIEEVYNRLRTQFWGANKEEATKNWFNNVYNYLIYKDLPTISHKSYNKLSDKAKRLCVVYEYRNRNHKMVKRFYVKIPKGAYKIQFKRAYITHRKRIDPKLEQAEALLWQQLDKKGYYEEQQKIYSYKNDWDLHPVLKSRKQVKLNLKKLQKYSIDEIIKEKISWERN